MLMRRLAPVGALLGLLALMAFGAHAVAQEKPAPAPNSEEAQQIEGEKAFEAALKARTVGPAEVPLLKQAVLKVPAGYSFIPKAEGDRMMRAMGNRTGSNFLGLVTQTDAVVVCDPRLQQRRLCARRRRQGLESRRVAAVA